MSTDGQRDDNEHAARPGESPGRPIRLERRGRGLVAESDLIPAPLSQKAVRRLLERVRDRAD
jgi:hypothetical protein